MALLISKVKIQKAVQRLARQIVKDYGEKEIVLVILLKGALYFGVDLSRAIQRRRKTDKLYIEFMRVKSYGNAKKSSGVVEIIQDVERSIVDRHVIIIDDVADTCQTLATVKEHLRRKKPRSMRFCVMFSKTDQSKRVRINLDYIGLHVEGFLVGNGLDDKGASRALEYVRAS